MSKKGPDKYEAHIRMTKEEANIILKRMKEAGTGNMSAYFRRMGLHGYILRLDTSEFKEILRVVQRCGNNLNQYARVANQTGSIYQDDIRELQADFKKIIELLRGYLDRFAQMR